MASLEEFSRRIGRLGVRVERNADQLVRKVALAAHQAVVLATPVDTGRARSNWLVAFDSPDRGTRESLAPGLGGSSGAAVTAAALGEAQGRITQYNGAFNRAIILSNNLPYIGRLNEGYSAQAPAGFVEMSIQAAVSVIRGVKLLDGD